MDGGVVVYVVATVAAMAGVLVLLRWFDRAGSRPAAADMRREAEFAPLVEALGGEITGDTVGGAHAGYPARATKRDPRRTYGTATEDEDYEVYRDAPAASCDYELTLTVAAPGQGRDWSLVYRGERIIGRGHDGWHTASPDRALRRRLIDAGAPAAMDRYGAAWTGIWQPAVVYSAARGTLTYRETLEDRLARPTVEECRAQLDLLTHLAQINDRVNAAGAPAAARR